MGDKISLNLPKKRNMVIQATFIKRTLAFLIDLIIIQFIIIFPFKKIFEKLIPITGSIKENYMMLSNVQGITSQLYTISFFIALMIFLYFTFTEYITGRSVGKKIMGLYIISENKQLKLGYVMLRNLALFPFFPFIALWLIDPAFMIFTKSQKRLSDIITKTKVVHIMQHY